VSPPPHSTTVIRFAGLYGPGKYQMLREIVQGKIQITKTEEYTNRIHRSDAARMIHFLIEQDKKSALLLKPILVLMINLALKMK